MKKTYASTFIKWNIFWRTMEFFVQILDLSHLHSLRAEFFLLRIECRLIVRLNLIDSTIYTESIKHHVIHMWVKCTIFEHTPLSYLNLIFFLSEWQSFWSMGEWLNFQLLHAVLFSTQSKISEGGCFLSKKIICDSDLEFIFFFPFKLRATQKSGHWNEFRNWHSGC